MRPGGGRGGVGRRGGEGGDRGRREGRVGDRGRREGEEWCIGEIGVLTLGVAVVLQDG